MTDKAELLALAKKIDRQLIEHAIIASVATPGANKTSQRTAAAECATISRHRIGATGMNAKVVPEGVCGNYRIERFEVTQEQSDRTALSFWRDEHVPVGIYTRLMRGSTVVMSDTPMEKRTNWWIMNRAHGRVLVNGLGIGMVLRAILDKEAVTDVTVVEKHEEVIRLVGPSFAHDSRLTIVHADALEYSPPKGARFDCVWHDIWDFICADNLPEMHRLHRRYGRRAERQASWCREQCEMAR